MGAKRAIEDVSSMDGNHHPAKRLAMASAEPLEPAPRPTGAALLSALVLVTDPLPTALFPASLLYKAETCATLEIRVHRKRASRGHARSSADRTRKETSLVSRVCVKS